MALFEIKYQIVEKDAYVQHLIRFMKKNDNVMETHSFMRTACILQWLDSRSLVQLAHSVVPRDLEPFDSFKGQGELLEEVFVVQQGHLKLVQRIGNTSVTLALLGPGDVGGVSDLIVSLARGKTDAHCRCAYRTEGQKAKLLLITRRGFEKAVLSSERIRPMVEDLVRIRLVWEAMRVRHKQRHPGTHMALTHNMMETYGYTCGPATDMVEKRRRTSEEEDARRRLYETGKMARMIYRNVGMRKVDGMGVGLGDNRQRRPLGHVEGGSGAWGSSMRRGGTGGEDSGAGTTRMSSMKYGGGGGGGAGGNPAASMDATLRARLGPNASASKQLRHAHELFVKAVSHANDANLPKESAIAEQLSRECLNALFLEDYSSLRHRAHRLSLLAVSNVNVVSAAFSSIPPPKPMTVGGNTSDNAEELRKLSERKQRVETQAWQAEHKLMVAYSAWVRATGVRQAGLEIAMQNRGGGDNRKNSDGRDAGGGGDGGGTSQRGSLTSFSGGMARNDAAKMAMKKALKECAKEQAKLKRIMKQFGAKQQENKTGAQKRRSLHTSYNSSSDGSSDGEMGLDWSAPVQQASGADAADSVTSEDSPFLLPGTGDALDLEFGQSRVNWNMQGSIVPHRPDAYLDGTLSPAAASPDSPRPSARPSLRSAVRALSPLLTTTLPAPLSPFPSPPAHSKSLPTRGPSSPLSRRVKKNNTALHNTRCDPSDDVIIPDPLPRKIVDWHIVVVEANRSSASLLRHHVETQARSTFGKSCVVERLERLPARKHIKRTHHHHKSKQPRRTLRHESRDSGSPSNGEDATALSAASRADDRDATPRFTFVVIDIGRIFPEGLSAQAIERRKRKKGWWGAAVKRAKKAVHEARVHFAEGTAIVVTSDEPKYQGLLEKITKDGDATGWIGKPYAAMGVRKLLRCFVADHEP